MRYLSWIITLPIALAAVLFALSNRELVEFSLWPFPLQVTAPLYLASLVFLVAGFVAGGFIAWANGHHHRAAARRNAARAERLERELADARERAAFAEKRVSELTRPARPPAGVRLPVPADPAARQVASH